MSIGLRQLAAGARFELLAHILDMAAEEADTQAQVSADGSGREGA
jgi:hypothetical protein